MEDANLMGRWMKKLRVLTLALIFSGALNVGLVAAFVFSVLQGKQSTLSIPVLAKGSANHESTIQQTFAQMAGLSFHEIVSFLTNRDSVDEGYLKRDLAVAALTSLHHFNLEKALSSSPLQRRLISFADDKKVEIFPGLTDDQFQAIIRFAYEEKWPLTSKGMFKLLNQWPEPKEASLVQAFLITPEFHSLQVLFQQTDTPQESDVLLKLVLEGNWDLLDRFAKEQSQMLDLSVEKRRRLLLSYLSCHSPTAAALLLKTDFVFAAKKLEDRGAIDLMGLLKGKTDEGERLCLELLHSPRSDAVWEAAALCLYRFAEEAVPTPFDLKVAMARFAPALVMPLKEETSVSKAVSSVPLFREHIVKDGESLWKISRQYKVKVEEIVKINNMEQDRLYPGMTLRIPQ